MSNKIKLRKDGIFEGVVPLYGIYIYYSPDAKPLRKMYDLPAAEKEPNGFCCWKEGKGNVGIYLPLDDYALCFPTLAHEAFHAAMKIGDLVGLRPTLEDNESIAYLISWITGWVMDCVAYLQDKDKKALPK